MIIDRRRDPEAGPPDGTATATERACALAALAAGVAAWLFYLGEDLVLSHYDAKAHLVVARRVIDNITPGWQQIGAVWLPLPHLINLLPVQVDLFYRTGAFGSFVSIASFGVMAWAMARLVLLITGSRAGAFTSAALLVLNPNLLYLQATPMTEPLFAACIVLVVLWLYEWVARNRDDVPATLGWGLFAAAWTRYEAWPVIAAALFAVLHVLWRSGLPAATVARRMWRLARWPAAAVGLFLIISRITVGAWFVSDGFYVPDPEYAGRVWRTLVGIWWGTHQMSGYIFEVVALVTALVFVVRALARRDDAALLLPVALFAAAAVPFVAFIDGHPYRIRYMVPVVAACVLFAGLAVGMSGGEQGGRRSRVVGRVPDLRARGAPLLLAAVLVASALVESPPWEEHPPLVSEAQWDVPLSLNRRAVTACLAPYRGEKILASMGSLAHYMQELSRSGFAIADFIHEGTGTIWNLAAETGPAPHAGWMLVDEDAEGGDVLAQRIRRDPAFIDGMTRVCDGGGVALYRRRR